MSEINDSYTVIKHEVQDLKDLGVSFDFKGIDLSDVLISELIASKISSNSRKTEIIVPKFKWFLYFLSKRIKYSTISLLGRVDVLVFVSTPNQWMVLEPVCETLESRGLRIHYLTTKERIFNNFFLTKSSKAVVLGYSFFSKKVFSWEENKTIQLINNYIPKIDFLHKYFTKIIEKSRSKYILVGNDSTYEGRLLSKVAKSHNITVGTIQHGSLNRLNIVRGLSNVNHYFVFGEKSADELVYLGKNKEEVFVSGWPLQSKIKKEINLSKRKNLSRFSCDLLVCLSGPGHSVSLSLHYQVINLIIQLQQNINVSVLIKVHPKDKKEYYEGFNKDLTLILDDNDLDISNVNLLDLFTVAKCTLTIASTAALESLLVQTPVITIDISNKFSEVDFITDGLTYHVSNYDELERAFKLVYEPSKKSKCQNMKQNLEKYYHNFFSEDFNPVSLISDKIMKTCVG